MAVENKRSLEESEDEAKAARKAARKEAKKAARKAEAESEAAARWASWDACRGGCVCEGLEEEDCQWIGFKGCQFCWCVQKKACSKKACKKQREASEEMGREAAAAAGEEAEAE